MVWFMGWATDWSQTSNYLQHAYIHWMTRGLCEFYSRVNCNYIVNTFLITFMT